MDELKLGLVWVFVGLLPPIFHRQNFIWIGHNKRNERSDIKPILELIHILRVSKKKPNETLFNTKLRLN